jgi:hypothetical protein
MTTIEDLDGEIARLQAEVRSVEHMPPTIAERYSEVEGAMREAEAVYRRLGLGASAGHPAEHAHLQRQVLIGACMVAAGDKLLKVERQRIEKQGEGLTAADKARKLDQLKAAILRTAAQRELALREVEGDGFLPRPIHPELLVFPQAEVERLAR